MRVIVAESEHRERKGSCGQRHAHGDDNGGSGDSRLRRTTLLQHTAKGPHGQDTRVAERLDRTPRQFDIPTYLPRSGGG